MKLINLTLHAIAIQAPAYLTYGAKIIAIPPSGALARLAETVTDRPSPVYIDGEDCCVPLREKEFGTIEGLPEPETYPLNPDDPSGFQAYGIGYVVSALVAQAAWEQGREDVFCPGDPVRDEAGRIIGCASLCARPASMRRKYHCETCAPSLGEFCGQGEFAPEGKVKTIHLNAVGNCAFCGYDALTCSCY